ncbi:hypothetical protein SAMN03159406_01874 [Rhizobium sp. NFR03]|nr:hypothetical protein SAMN03159406_01874 [Rhizobium sp. NFR03]
MAGDGISLTPGNPPHQDIHIKVRHIIAKTGVRAQGLGHADP